MIDRGEICKRKQHRVWANAPVNRRKDPMKYHQLVIGTGRGVERAAGAEADFLHGARSRVVSYALRRSEDDLHATIASSALRIVRSVGPQIGRARFGRSIADDM